MSTASEECRLSTFDSDWPHDFVSPRILAKTGFYYIGPYDQVRCHFCRVRVRSWEIGDNEVNEHLRWSPRCPLLMRCDTTNVPLKPISELDRLLPPPSPLISFDVCGSNGAHLERRPGSYAETHFSTPSASVFQHQAPVTDYVETLATMAAAATGEYEFQTFRRRPEFPEYAIEMARLRSFEEWPKTMKQKPEQLSDAGFFYTQKSDRVICFSCGGGLREWDEDDDPWEQHVLWYEKCDYLRLIKGPEYIAAVKEKFSKIHNHEKGNDSESPSSSSSSSPSTSTSWPSSSQREDICSSSSSNNSSNCSMSAITSNEQNTNEDTQLNEARLCKICYASEYNTAFFPCGHVCACGKCASSQTKCPLCRQPFECVMRIFLS